MRRPVRLTQREEAGGRPELGGMAEEEGQKFASLAAEVEAVLRRIREREARAEASVREKYRPRFPQNIFKQLPGRADFEYIKVPKKKAELCFGSKTERKVFPDIPQVLKSGSMPIKEDRNKLNWKQPRRLASAKNETGRREDTTQGGKKAS